MPEYLSSNFLETNPKQDVPHFFWDGETEMACVHDAMQSVLRFAYAHHIQRLMVLGLFAQLIGVSPRNFHAWHMAMYADAIDWVSAANTIGMSQYGDGGLMSTKPYVASGSYIDRMGNYCKSCRFDPKQATGDKACPFTTLYWDFLDRHQNRLAGNQRMKLQLRNLERKGAAEMEMIRQQAGGLRKRLT
jgi:deoxyribodipyrimidine photolyase-related protein